MLATVVAGIIVVCGLGAGAAVLLAIVLLDVVTVVMVLSPVSSLVVLTMPDVRAAVVAGVGVVLIVLGAGAGVCVVSADVTGNPVV